MRDQNGGNTVRFELEQELKQFRTIIIVEGSCWFIQNKKLDFLRQCFGDLKQQLVEIAKALAKKVKLLILDEPTASLNDNDSAKLLELLLQFKAHGISSILISHKLSEVKKVADSITILRDGATIETLDCHKDNITEDRIIRGMVGRDITHRFPPRDSKIGETIFEVQDWNVYHPLHEDRKVS